MPVRRIDWADAVRFWETGRLGYNGVLAAMVFAVAIGADAWGAIAHEFPLIVILGAVANLLYCIVYPLDAIAQAAGLRDVWGPARRFIWAAGTALAAALALAALVGVGGGMGPPD